MEADDVEIFVAKVAEKVAAATVGENAINVECRHTQCLRKTDARRSGNRCVIEIRHLNLGEREKQETNRKRKSKNVLN